MLLLHTYAPRTVDVEVDLDIVKSLHAAYQPEVEPTWPLRPEHRRHRQEHSTARSMRRPRSSRRCAPRSPRSGSTVADSATYPLHPSTLAWDHVMARPGRALCLEVRRDLLADPFEPFVQMRIGAAKVERLAGPLAAALRRWW